MTYMQSLEGRRLFAVSVEEAYPGYYEVHGDDGADAIDISVSQSEESFTLDGTTYYGVAYIFVYGYGGADTISLLSEDGSGSIAASIDANDGSDSITLNFDGAVWAGCGNDQLHLSDAFQGEVYGDDGNDHIYVSGGCVNPVIRGGDGNDLIDASGNYCGVTIHGENGNDVIYGTAYDDEIHGGDGGDVLYGGTGNDAFHTRDGESDTVYGGEGWDAVYSDGQDDADLYEVEFQFQA